MNCLGALFLAFWVLPMLLTPLTPFKYQDIIDLTRDALVTAFTTGNLFVVLTVLTESCKNLFNTYALTDEKTDTYVDVIVPISFNFPNTGKLLMLLFILFNLAVQNIYTKDEVIANMQSMVFPVDRDVLDSVEAGVRPGGFERTLSGAHPPVGYAACRFHGRQPAVFLFQRYR
jgi:hypothetical protein